MFPLVAPSLDKYLATKEDSFEGNVRQSAMKSFWELKKRHTLSHF